MTKCIFCNEPTTRMARHDSTFQHICTGCLPKSTPETYSKQQMVDFAVHCTGRKKTDIEKMFNEFILYYT